MIRNNLQSKINLEEFQDTVRIKKNFLSSMCTVRRFIQLSFENMVDVAFQTMLQGTCKLWPNSFLQF